MPTLEQEFEEQKALHKYVILKAKIVQYYKDLNEMQSPNIPTFLLTDRIDQQADQDISEILRLPDGLYRFNSLYERAWEEIREKLI